MFLWVILELSYSINKCHNKVLCPNSQHLAFLNISFFCFLLYEISSRTSLTIQFYYSQVLRQFFFYILNWFYNFIILGLGWPTDVSILLDMCLQLSRCCKWLLLVQKLDGIGPVYNRPSTDQLNHFVKFC